MCSVFFNKVKNNVFNKLHLNPASAPVIVALSGGADSVALLSVMTELGFNCIAAHCNFALRGTESLRDRNFALETARLFGAEFREVTFDVEQRKTTTGESTEMACRELRYEWFETIKKETGAQAVATGHHCGDNIETMFLNLLRGTGLRGAAGMSVRGFRRVSPLINCSKTEILEYLSSRNLNYVTDSSNLSNEYSRNKIRNEILPTIEKVFPDALNRLATSMKFMEEDRRLLENYINDLATRYANSSLQKIELAKLIQEQPMAKAILFKMLSPLGFNREQTDAMVQSVSGSKFSSPTHEAIISRNILEIFPKDEKSQIIYTTEVLPISEFRPQSDGGTAWFSPNILEGDPMWEQRAWQVGDRIKPFGMNGKSKKVSDVFNNLKVPESVKREPRIVLRNGEIVWIIGVRNSNLFKVKSDDKYVVCMKIVKNQREA